jgi:hypothetical protein
VTLGEGAGDAGQLESGMPAYDLHEPLARGVVVLDDDDPVHATGLERSTDLGATSPFPKTASEERGGGL